MSEIEWKCPNCGRINDGDVLFCSICQTQRPKNKLDFKLFATVAGAALAAMLVALLVVLFILNGKEKKVAQEVEATPQIIYIQTVPTPVPTFNPQDMVNESDKGYGDSITGRLPENPKSIYGKYLKATRDGQKYPGNPKEYVDIIGESYGSRKVAGTNTYDIGYHGALIKNNATGFPISFYFGDGLPYYVEIRDRNNQANILVKLYYWGEEMVAVRDYRKDGKLLLADQKDISSYISEFESVFDIGLDYSDNNLR